MKLMTMTCSRGALGALALSLAACAQFTTSTTERAGLQSAADAAATAYLDCLDREAGRYLGTTNDAQGIGAIARKNCAGSRDAAAKAQASLQSTSYIMSDREVTAAMKALDDKGQTAITEQVLNRRAPDPAPAAAAAATAAAAVAPPVPAAASKGYLDCMQAQGERWAATREPAAVIADAAHSRCSAQLPGGPGAAEAEKQGRALVLGLVLDRKTQTPGDP